MTGEKRGRTTRQRILDVTVWRIATVAPCTVFAARRAPWEDLLVPRGMPRAQWLERMAEQVAGSVTSRLRFRCARPGSGTQVE